MTVTVIKWFNEEYLWIDLFIQMNIIWYMAETNNSLDLYCTDKGI